MTSNSTKLPVLGSDGEIAVGLLDEWFDPTEAGLRDRVRDFDFIQTMIESELEAVSRRCCAAASAPRRREPQPEHQHVPRLWIPPGGYFITPRWLWADRFDSPQCPHSPHSNRNRSKGGYLF